MDESQKARLSAVIAGRRAANELADLYVSQSAELYKQFGEHGEAASVAFMETLRDALVAVGRGDTITASAQAARLAAMGIAVDFSARAGKNTDSRTAPPEIPDNLRECWERCAFGFKPSPEELRALWSLAGFPLPSPRRRCNDCNCTGRVDGIVCPTCGSSGYLPVEDWDGCVPLGG